MSTSIGTMDGKVCIVTGGNTGIGKETARGLLNQGATVVIACRDVSKGEAARAEIAGATGGARVSVMALDLASKASIRAFAAAFQAAHPRLDVLVNNAGISPRTRSTTMDGFETTFGVNHLGTFLLTHELLGLLKASAPARVVTVSSWAHSSGHMLWDDPMFERRAYSSGQAYSQSKLANVLFTVALAERLAGTGVTANALNPGTVATEFLREYPKLLQKIAGFFILTPAQGAATSLHLATSPEVAQVTGKYFDKSREKVAAAEARDPAAQKRLWELSERLLGLSG